MTPLSPEQTFLGCCLQDPSLIDKAIQDGIREAAFTSPDTQGIWRALLTMRAAGKHIDTQAVFLENQGRLSTEALFACDAAATTTLHAASSLKSIIEAHRLRELRPILKDALSQIDDGGNLDAVKAALSGVEDRLSPIQSQERGIEDVIDEAISFATAEFSGVDTGLTTVRTGIKGFDNSIGPIMPHEYVIVGARTSHGKSSFMTQMAGTAIEDGLRVAYFTLETSAKAVALQIAAQRSGVNLRRLNDEFKHGQEAFLKELRKLRSSPLALFEKDLSLEQIESRCRLLKASFRPDVVFIDYLGLIRVKEKSAYERMTALSKAMIPLRKSLDCALIVAAQLNRGNEKDHRKPTRTDFRDSGSIEEDAHRIIALHRPEKDGDGQENALNYSRSEYLTELYQLKCRDGALGEGRCNFLTRSTKFEEILDGAQKPSSGSFVL